MRASLVLLSSLVAVAAATATPASAEGFRAEIHGGWDHPSADGYNDDGLLYGIGLGYDLNVGKGGFVGVDFSLDDSTQRDCEHNVVVNNDRACLGAGRDIAIGLRGGVNVSQQGKIYALAGYTNARFRSSYTTPAGVTTHDADNLDGFRLGAGYQHALGSNSYAKVEYRYSNYEQDLDRHQVLVGVGMTF